jgi:small subunit ribosomal protein S20
MRQFTVDIQLNLTRFSPLSVQIFYMPNTKSAERRARSNERKHQHNRSIKSRLRRLEKDYRTLLADGKKAEAVKLLPGVHSAFDKAVKSGVLPRATVNRKKSRLAAALN